MLDDLKYEYVEVGAPNVLWAKERDKSQMWPKTVDIHPRLRALIYEASKKFPAWKFVVKTKWHCGDVGTLCAFDVYANRERLGGVSFGGDRRGDPAFTVSGARIPNRKNRITTKDEKKALTVVRKYFKPETVKERVRAVLNDIDTRTTVSLSVASDNYTKARKSILGAVESFILANEAQVRDFMQNRGDDPTVLDNYINQKHKLDVIERAKKKVNSSGGATVIRDKDKYIVADSEDAFFTAPDNTLPAYMRQALGMLKLIDNGEFLDNVGYRYDENLFYIFHSTT